MMRDVRLLLALRIRCWWNAARAAPPAHKWVGGLLAAGSVLLFAGIFLAGAALLTAARSQGTAALFGIIERAFLFLFLFLLVGGIPFVSGALLTPGDLPLLASAPVRPAALMAARLVDAVLVSSAQFVVIGVPLLVASGWAAGLSAGGWPGFIALLLLFLALPPLLVALFLIALARVVGVGRVRAVVAVASALLAVVMCLFAVREFAAWSATKGLMSAAVVSVPNTEDNSMPSAWVAHALFALASPHPARAVAPALVLLGATFLAGALCVWLGGPVLVGESLLEGDGTGRYGAGRGIMDRLLAALPLSPAARALVGKDLRYVARDLVLLSQIGIPIILYFVPFVIGAQMAGPGSGTSGNTNDLMLLFSVGIVGLIAFMETSILGLSSVGLEGRGFWIVLAAPVSSGELIRAKWGGALGVSLGLTVPLLLASCLVYRASLLWTACGLFVLAVACAALCGLGVGLSGLFPRFVYENPAHRASLTALIWGFVGATLYVIVAGTVLGLALALAPQWPERANDIVGAGVGIFLAISLATGWFPLAMARARLDDYTWEE